MWRNHYMFCVRNMWCNNLRLSIDGSHGSKSIIKETFVPLSWNIKLSSCRLSKLIYAISCTKQWLHNCMSKVTVLSIHKDKYTCYFYIFYIAIIIMWLSLRKPSMLAYNFCPIFHSLKSHNSVPSQWNITKLCTLMAKWSSYILV